MIALNSKVIIMDNVFYVPGMTSLQDMCRQLINRHATVEHLSNLGIPNSMITYVSYSTDSVLI